MVTLVLVCAIVCGIQSGMITAVGSLVDADYESDEEDSDSDSDSDQPALQALNATCFGTTRRSNCMSLLLVMRLLLIGQVTKASALALFASMKPLV